MDKLSPNALDILQKLLTIDVDKRITVLEALNHPFIIENKEKELYNKILDEKIAQKLLTNLKHYKKN